jgi:hypothetical protein
MEHTYYPSLFDLRAHLYKQKPGKFWTLDAEVEYLGESVHFHRFVGRNPDLLAVSAVKWYSDYVKLACGARQHESFKVEGSDDVQLPLPF